MIYFKFQQQVVIFIICMSLVLPFHSFGQTEGVANQTNKPAQAEERDIIKILTAYICALFL